MSLNFGHPWCRYFWNLSGMASSLGLTVEVVLPAVLAGGDPRRVVIERAAADQLGHLKDVAAAANDAAARRAATDRALGFLGELKRLLSGINLSHGPIAAADGMTREELAEFAGWLPKVIGRMRDEYLRLLDAGDRPDWEVLGRRCRTVPRLRPRPPRDARAVPGVRYTPRVKRLARSLLNAATVASLVLGVASVLMRASV